MMEGTPARLEMLTSTILVSQLSAAYSSRYTAAPTPKGTLTRPIIERSHTEPNKAGQMPELTASEEGKPRINSQLKLGRPSRNMSTSRTPSTTSPKRVETNTRAANTRSRKWRVVFETLKTGPCSGDPAPRCSVLIPLPRPSVGLPVAPDEQVADEVEDQRHQEQGHADGEDRLVDSGSPGRLP